MKYDLLVQNGDVVFPFSGVRRCDIAVSGGKVAALLDRGTTAQANEVINAHGLTVFPGIIDPHVHMQVTTSPNPWRTETSSAVIGGVTTVIDGQMGLEAYSKRFVKDREAAESEALCDFAFQFTIATEEQVEEVPMYAAEFGVPSYKMYMSFKGEEGAYLGIPGTDDGFLFNLMEQIARSNAGPLSLHTENIEVVWRLRDRLQRSGRKDLAAFTESRPGFVEAVDIHKALHYSHITGCPIHIVHLTSKDALDVIDVGRRLYPNAKITGETCPQYLTFTCDAPTVLARVNPPVKYPQDKEALWAALARGDIQTMGTDHVSRDLKGKLGSGGGTDVWRTQSGFPGVGTLLPLLLSEGYHKGRLSLAKIAELTSHNIANLYGMPFGKGSLHVGADADMAIVDLNLEKRLSADIVGSHCDWNLWDGWQVKGWPVRTLVRGTTVMLDGKVVQTPGFGRYLPRGAARCLS